MGVPLKNPPVYCTLVQVRFNRLLKLADFLPAIQEAFRKAGYPDYETRSIHVVQLPTDSGTESPQLVVQHRHSFTNVQKTHSFLLDEGTLSLQSTDYGTFEKFSSEFLQGLARVHAEVGLAITERVGLRYLDRIVPRTGETLSVYLIDPVLGLSHDGCGKHVHSYAESRLSVDNISLITRVIIQDSPLVFPPDIEPLGLTVPKRFQTKGLHAVLDTDGFIEGKEQFEMSTVGEKLSGIHLVISDCFKKIAKPHAFKVWNEQ